MVRELLWCRTTFPECTVLPDKATIHSLTKTWNLQHQKQLQTLQIIKQLKKFNKTRSHITVGLLEMRLLCQNSPHVDKYLNRKYTLVHNIFKTTMQHNSLKHIVHNISNWPRMDKFVKFWINALLFVNSTTRVMIQIYNVKKCTKLFLSYENFINTKNIHRLFKIRISKRRSSKNKCSLFQNYNC